MPIQFLKDHSVGEGADLETFKEGQIVNDRSAASEYGFVRRGVAAFIRGAKLLDHEERVIGAAASKSAVGKATPAAKKAPAKKPAKKKPVKKPAVAPRKRATPAAKKAPAKKPAKKKPVKKPAVAPRKRAAPPAMTSGQ